MDLVDEENSPLTVDRLALFCRLDNGPQLGNTPCDCREGHELRFGVARNEMRQGRLAGAWRSPENDGGKLIGLDGPPQRSIRRRDVLLPDEIRKLSRPQTLGQRSFDGRLSFWSSVQVGSLIAGSSHSTSQEWPELYTPVTMITNGP